MNKVLIVGAGFSGAVIAERLSLKHPNCEITIIDERDHIGGNCFTYSDIDTGVTVHKYGPHIFHTDKKHVWEYIQNFCTMMPFINRVKSVVNGEVYSMPINLHTINQFYGSALSPSEVGEFFKQISCRYNKEPENFEEQALSMIGEDLYNAFFYGYTKKQWGCEPKELPASILKRLPVRFNYDDNYYNSQYQGIPQNGYTEIFKNMLNRPNIKLILNQKFETYVNNTNYDHIFYTGPIDRLFDYKFGRLSYRTVTFEKQVSEGDFQGNAVINYPSEDVKFTRIHEHKHFTPWLSFDKTVYFKEYSKETEITDEPYYPKRLRRDMELFEKYQLEATYIPNFTLLGRLATYRYLDMHNVIDEALNIVNNF
jgi:UDP-galactopyranose mutase